MFGFVLDASELLHSAWEIGWGYGWERDTPARMLESLAREVGRTLSDAEAAALLRGYACGVAERAVAVVPVAAVCTEPVPW